MATFAYAPVMRHTVLAATTRLTTAGGAVGTAALFAAAWLAVSLLSALVYWVLLLLLFRRRGQPMNRRMLFAVLFLVAFAGSNLVAVDMLTPHLPLFALPVSGLFLLYFYFFPDARFTSAWTRWLALLYGISQIGPLFPSSSSSKQPSPQAAQFLSSATAGPLGGLVTLGLDAAAVAGDMFVVTVVVCGILPQVYSRYRHFRETAEPYRLGKRTEVKLGIAMAAGSFVVLAVSNLLTESFSPAASPLFLVARTGYFMLVTLVPVALGFSLLHGRTFDRDALTNRALIYGTLSLCLILIYIATTGLQIFFPGLLAFPFILVYIAIVTPLLVALFPPLYARIQDRIDRRFYRSRYDAAKMLAAYRATVREDIYLDQMSERLTATLQKAMVCRFVTLWLRTPAAAVTPYYASIAALPASVGGRIDLDAPGQRTPEMRLRRQVGTDAPPTGAAALLIAPDDAARTTLLRPANGTEVAQLPEDSPVAYALREEKVALALSLLWQGELVGLIALGAHQDERPYT
ncbi:MAG: hypothetical protein ACRDHP_05065, partial [Ktedonobacterales bacterium]